MTPGDYFRVARGHKIVETVTMEGEWNSADPVGESPRLQTVADEFGFPNALVVQAWLDADNVAEVLKARSKKSTGQECASQASSK